MLYSLFEEFINHEMTSFTVKKAHYSQVSAHKSLGLSEFKTSPGNYMKGGTCHFRLNFESRNFDYKFY